MIIYHKVLVKKSIILVIILILFNKLFRLVKF